MNRSFVMASQYDGASERRKVSFAYYAEADRAGSSSAESKARCSQGVVARQRAGIPVLQASEGHTAAQ